MHWDLCGFLTAVIFRHRSHDRDQNDEVYGRDRGQGNQPQFDCVGGQRALESSESGRLVLLEGRAIGGIINPVRGAPQPEKVAIGIEFLQELFLEHLDSLASLRLRHFETN